MERWREVPIPNYKDLYEISDKGRVYSVRKKKCLQPKMSNAGYYRVSLSVNGCVKIVPIHRMVAMAFIPNNGSKPTVNHINEIKTDNRVENLEWATIQEQNIHGTRVQRAVAHTDYKNRGIDYKTVAAHHDYSRQNMCGRKPVKVWDVSNTVPVFVGEFRSQKEASDFTGVSRGKVSECVSKKSKPCKGYMFEETSNPEDGCKAKK